MLFAIKRTVVVVDHKEELPKYIIDALEEFGRSGKDISGIKLLRGYINRDDYLKTSDAPQTCGLKEAKDFWDTHFRDMRAR